MVTRKKRPLIEDDSIESKQPKQLTGPQLKRLIENVIKEAPTAKPPTVEVVHVWAEATAMGIESLVEQMDPVELASLIDDAASGYGDDVPYPARLEDVDAFAQAAAEMALRELAHGSALSEHLTIAIASAMRRGF